MLLYIGLHKAQNSQVQASQREDVTFRQILMNLQLLHPLLTHTGLWQCLPNPLPYLRLLLPWSWLLVSSMCIYLPDLSWNLNLILRLKPSVPYITTVLVLIKQHLRFHVSFPLSSSPMVLNWYAECINIHTPPQGSSASRTLQTHFTLRNHFSPRSHP
jgi:hypothetical protein